MAWYRKAADQGTRPVHLGHVRQGEGVPQDDAPAVPGTARPPNRGTAMRNSALAPCTKNGRGVPQDYAQALAWYRKAADKGDADAQ